MIPFVITNAGLTALANVGTLGPVNLSTVKIGSGAYTPSGTVTALQTVISTLTPIGSSVPATGVVHMTFEDAPLSSLARHFYQDCKRVSNQKMVSHLGVSLHYPTYKVGLTEIWEKSQK